MTAKFKQMAPVVANAIGFGLLPGVTLIVFYTIKTELIVLLLSKLRLLLDLFICNATGHERKGLAMCKTIGKL